MGMRVKSTIGVILLLLAGTAIVGVQSTKVPPDTILPVTTPAVVIRDPYFSFKHEKVVYGFYNSTGAWQSSETDKGRIVVLYFWSTWCQPCEAMTLWLNRLWRRYEQTGLTMTAIALDTEAETVQRTVRAQKTELPYAVLPKEIITNAQKINGAPMILVLSKNGRILKRIEGVVSEQTFESDLLTWLQKK